MNPRNGKASTKFRDLQPDTTSEKKIREEGLTPDNILLRLANELTTNLICFGGWKRKDFRKG